MHAMNFFLPRALSHARVFPCSDAKATLLRDPTYANLRSLPHGGRRRRHQRVQTADGRSTSFQMIHPRIPGRLDPNRIDEIIQEQDTGGQYLDTRQLLQSTDAFLIGSINALHFPAC